MASITRLLPTFHRLDRAFGHRFGATLHPHIDEALERCDVAQDCKTPQHERYPTGQQSENDQRDPFRTLEQTHLAIEAASFGARADITGQQRTCCCREDQQSLNRVNSRTFEVNAAARGK
jgi:hypothetical protein